MSRGAILSTAPQLGIKPIHKYNIRKSGARKFEEFIILYFENRLYFIDEAMWLGRPKFVESFLEKVVNFLFR